MLTIVRERIEAGAAPTLRELAAELGITVRGAGGAAGRCAGSERDVSGARIHPFDAWALDGGLPEPWGSHPSVDAALRALDGRGGAVTAGMTFIRWHDATGEQARDLLGAALKSHGIHRGPPPWRDTPW